jgi:hypothetical protein
MDGKRTVRTDNEFFNAVLTILADLHVMAP